MFFLLGCPFRFSLIWAWGNGKKIRAAAFRAIASLCVSVLGVWVERGYDLLGLSVVGGPGALAVNYGRTAGDVCENSILWAN